MTRLSSADLQWRINATVDYLMTYWGLPAVTAKTLVLNIVGTLAGSFTRVKWREAEMSLSMSLVITPGVVDENRGYADFLAQPLENEILRRREKATDEASFSTKKRSLEETTNGMSHDAAEYAKYRDAYLTLLETNSPWFALRTLPSSKQYDPLLSTVLLDDSGDVLRCALKDETGGTLTTLAQGTQFSSGKRRFYGANLEAPHDEVGKLLGSNYGRFWHPIVLPGGAGLPPTQYGAPARALVAKSWTEAVNELLIMRRAPERELRVSEYGTNVMNKIIELAGSRTQAVRHRGKFTWGAKVTVKLAAIMHLLKSDPSDEIHSSAWDEAELHMRLLIEGHALATDVISPRVVKPRAIHGRPEDLQTFNDYLVKNPKASFREVTRALPKRERGYWRAMCRAAFRFR